jgi:hypothetical protein
VLGKTHRDFDLEAIKTLVDSAYTEHSAYISPLECLVGLRHA